MAGFKMYLFCILLIWAAVLSLAGFVMMWLDKRKAKKGSRRIPEKHLFITAAAGGAVGILLGMNAFRHKTKHLSFTLGIPAILAVQIALTVLAWVQCF